MQNLTFHPRLILRTPHETFSEPINEAGLQSYIQTETFHEALYLASPSLLKAVKSSPHLPEKLLLPLTRYAIRSRYRATPFGLFSGVGTARWGEETRVALKAEYGRQTHLDMDCLCTLARKLDGDRALREHLVYYPNSSYYLLGEDIRYIERRGTSVLSAVKNDRYVQAVLEKATGGAGFPALTETLRTLGISTGEAGAFLHQLADSQLIVSELEPVLTGEDFLEHILRTLHRVKHPAAEILEEIRRRLRQLDSPTGNDPAAYSEIIKLISELGITPDENKLFRTVRINLCEESAQTVSSEYREEILRVISKLRAFASDARPAAMSDFISRFYDRYEDAEVPLLTALDMESGIGYSAPVSEDYTPLTEGITLPSGEEGSSSLKWKELQQTLFRSLQKAQRDGAFEIPLPFVETPGAEALRKGPGLAPTFAVMFRLVGNSQLLIESIGGSSGIPLAGRFGHASEEIGQILREIAAEESKNNPGVIFAEVVHLPENRTGNILCRPAFRDYEIPYLAQSGLPQENQVHLRDLLVSVRNGQVVLRHKKRDQVVIPRLGCAHNFKSHSLPVYRFLCDLQTQGVQSSLDFSWGEIAREFVFLPRVTDGRVIISPAMWQFSSGHLQPLQQPNLPEETFEYWRKQHKVPSCFVLAEGDNELFIDSSNALLRRVFLGSVKGKKAVLLKEFWGDDSVPVRNAAGKAMVNQFVTFLIRKDPVYRHEEEKRPEYTVQRTFSLGSEWVYLKFYCGPKSADLILENGIAPIVQVAEMNRWIDQWFFIRYNDPENHLRVRFHLTDTGFLRDFLRIIESWTGPFERNGLVWKIQADTYRRELERYGYAAIEPVERLFHIDSRMYLSFLRETEGDERENLKWLWGLRNIDNLLHTAGFNTAGKKALMEKVRNRFAEEFKMDRDLKSQIDRRYRACRRKIEDFMGDTPGYLTVPPEVPLRNLWNEIREMAGHPPGFEHIVISTIHMTVNRLISSGQRLHELLMYDFLTRHYTSRVAGKRVRVS